MKSFTYPDSIFVKLLIPIFLALSCFAFSLSPVPTQARQHLPDQVENVVSSNDLSDVVSISFSRIVDIISFQHVAKPDREYRKKVLIAHQVEVDVSLRHLYEQHLSYQTFFQVSRRIIPQQSDEALPPATISLATLHKG